MGVGGVRRRGGGVRVNRGGINLVQTLHLDIYLFPVAKGLFPVSVFKRETLVIGAPRGVATEVMQNHTMTQLLP